MENKNMQIELQNKLDDFNKKKIEVDSLFEEIENQLAPLYYKNKKSLEIWVKYDRTRRYLNFFLSIIALAKIMKGFGFINSITLIVLYNIIFTIISKLYEKGLKEKCSKMKKRIWIQIHKRNEIISTLTLIKKDLISYIKLNITDIPSEILVPIKSISVYNFDKTKLEIESEEDAYKMLIQLESDKTRLLENEFRDTLGKVLRNR